LAKANDLCGMSAGDIVKRVAAGEISATEVLQAHLDRYEESHEAINAIVVPDFDRARATAANLDAARARGEALGPLHGVPVTVKECFALAGTATTVGLSARADQIDPHDGPLVARLRAAGAVILGKTNVPQLMLLHETDNPLFGRTNNPWATERTPGGSSGGEAAALAAGLAALGLGSDLGGSIRVPAHFCGVAGIKPTSRRLSQQGSFANFHGMEALQFQPGPMARTVADLSLALRVLIGNPAQIDDENVAPAPPPKPERVAIDRLKIAYWDDDGTFAASPAVRRAVREAAAALRAAGAEVSPWQPPGVAEAMRIYFGLMGADGGADLRALARGSRLDDRIKTLLRWSRAPRSWRPATAWVLRRAGQRRLGELLKAAGPRSAAD